VAVGRHECGGQGKRHKIGKQRPTVGQNYRFLGEQASVAGSSMTPTTHALAEARAGALRRCSAQQAALIWRWQSLRPQRH
jgi:hypothetical protein